MKSKFCCDIMCQVIQKSDVIEFEDYVRAYNLMENSEFITKIYFCPFCGQNLGKRLNSEYYDILYREYGIEYPEGKEADKVPPEFKSDEWWRKRGLQFCSSCK